MMVDFCMHLFTFATMPLLCQSPFSFHLFFYCNDYQLHVMHSLRESTSIVRRSFIILCSEGGLQQITCTLNALSCYEWCKYFECWIIQWLWNINALPLLACCVTHNLCVCVRECGVFRMRNFIKFYSFGMLAHRHKSKLQSDAFKMHEHLFRIHFGKCTLTLQPAGKKHFIAWHNTIECAFKWNVLEMYSHFPSGFMQELLLFRNA